MQSLTDIEVRSLSANLAMVAVTAWTWDLIICIPEEYTLLFKCKMMFPHYIYIFSRIFIVTFAFLCLTFIFVPTQDDGCKRLLTAITVIGPLAMISNTTLMFLRVRAVFNDEYIIKHLFTFFWAATVGVTLIYPLTLKPVVTGPSHTCLPDATISPFLSSTTIAATVYDTAILIAITYRLLVAHCVADNWRDRIRIYLSGNGLGHVSRLLLRTGQIYYLVTVCMNIATVVTILVPLHVSLDNCFIAANIGFTNIMACRVFRELKLGILMKIDNPTNDRRRTHSSFNVVWLRAVASFMSQPGP